MKKEQLLKTLQLTKEYNDDLYKKLAKVNKILKGESKKADKPELEDIQEILILVSVLLSGNIKARYELAEFLKENKAFMDLTTMKTITGNCKQDIEALKSISFSMVEVLKTMRSKEEEQKYKDQTL